MKILLIILNSFVIIASVSSQQLWDVIKDTVNILSKELFGTKNTDTDTGKGLHETLIEVGCVASVSLQINKDNKCFGTFDKEIRPQLKDQKDTKVWHSIDLDYNNSLYK